jgi:hypothetical protein
LLWGNWFACFFCLPIIAVGGVIVPVLCMIKYFLAVIIAVVIFRLEGCEVMLGKEVKREK